MSNFHKENHHNKESEHNDLISALKQKFESNQISVKGYDRLSYSRDLWPLQTMKFRAKEIPQMPLCIIWPKNEADIINLINIAREFKAPIIPYGGGSGVLGGTIAPSNGIIVDLKKMNKIISIDETSGICTVQPGIIGMHLEDQLNQAGFTLGHFPSSLMTATVGGYVATRSAGQFSSRYGKIEDIVHSIRFISGNGDVIDTKTASLSINTPSWNQIILGSEGTFGIITESTLKIVPLPPASKYRGIRFKTLQDGLNAMQKIMQMSLRPSVLRLYDELDTFLVGKGDEPLPAGLAQTARPDQINHINSVDKNHFAKNDSRDQNSSFEIKIDKAEHSKIKKYTKNLLDLFPSAVKTAVRLALSRPVVLESLIDSILPEETLLILGFEGEPEEVNVSLSIALQVCKDNNGRDIGEKAGLRWLAKRYDVSFKMPSFFQLGIFVDTLEVATTWDRIPLLYDSMKRVMGENVLVMAHFSHAYPEGVSIYFSIGGRASNQDETIDLYQKTWKKALETALTIGATVSHHHGVGIMKAPYVAIEQASFLYLFQQLKQIVDPDSIMNPKKLYI